MSDTPESPGVKNLSDIKDKFVEFAKEREWSSFTEYYGIFAFGTVVSLKLKDDKIFSGFNENVDFPMHRLINNQTHEEIMAEKQEMLDEILSRNEPYRDVILRAYNTLIADGYPYPGESGADRFAMPFCPGANEKIIFSIVFTERSPRVFTLVYQEDIDLGSECRRYDYMEPKLVYLVSPSLEVIEL